MKQLFQHVCTGKPLSVNAAEFIDTVLSASSPNE